MVRKISFAIMYT